MFNFTLVVSFLEHPVHRLVKLGLQLAWQNTLAYAYWNTSQIAGILNLELERLDEQIDVMGQKEGLDNQNNQNNEKDEQKEKRMSRTRKR